MRRFALLIVGLVMTGCALIEDQVPVNYVPPANLAVVPGAADVTLDVAAQDRRVSNIDRIGTKKNGYGMEMAKITATNDVVALVGSAVERELSSLGFRVGTGGIRTTVDLDTFYADFKPGFFSADTVAEVAFSLRAIKPDGSLVYSRSYKAVGTNPGIMIYDGDNARIALERALTTAIQYVVEDSDFHRALVAARKTPSNTGPPTS